MREPYVKELQLVYDASKVVTATNCQFWPKFEADKDLPGKGDLCMVALSLAIPFRQGVVVPQSFEELLDSIGAADDLPPILNGKPAPGFTDALRALKKNEFHSFFGSKNKYGIAEKHFDKNSRNLRQNHMSTTT